MVGGIIPAADHGKLHALGVSAVFGPESPLAAVVEAVRALAEGKPLPEDPAERAAQAGIPVTRLDHAAICVEDIKAAIALIEDVLGRPVSHRSTCRRREWTPPSSTFPTARRSSWSAPPRETQAWRSSSKSAATPCTTSRCG